VYDFGKLVGESSYRLMSRTGQFIYMRTKGILEIDETTRQVHSFVCTNTLMNEEEGRRSIKDMKKKYSAIISEAELSALESDVPAVENPNKLERAILNLITNLNNPAFDDDPCMSDASSISEVSVKKQPLAIIAPEPISIKGSIVRASSVLSHTFKHKDSPSTIKDEPKSPEPQLNTTSVKMEPLSNVMMSPTSSSSSMSSVDPLSPYASSSSSTTTNIPSSNTTTTNNSFTSLDEKYSQSKQILHEATGAISVITSTGGSIITSNNNRSSVLKRTHSKINDDDYNDSDEIIKKRVVNNSSNKDSLIETTTNAERQSFDILESTDAGEN
jgi:hypothetical protein